MPDRPRHERCRDGRAGGEAHRAIAFIDATFAVALTLLVTTLDLRSDPTKWDSVSHFYDSIGTQLVALAISFVVIAGYVSEWP